MNTFKDLIELNLNINLQMNDIFNNIWKPKFRTCMTKSEFDKVMYEFQHEIGIDNQIPSIIHVEICFELDALRQRNTKRSE
jgi:hypothetical protein